MAIPQATMKDQEIVSNMVMAAMKIMYDPKIFPKFKEGLLTKRPISDILAQEAVGLFKLLNDRATGRIPKHLTAAICVMIFSEMARFVKDAGMKDPSGKELSDGMKKMLLILFGLAAKEEQQKASGIKPGPAFGGTNQPPQAQTAPQQPPQAPMQPKPPQMGLLQSAGV